MATKRSSKANGMAATPAMPSTDRAQDRRYRAEDAMRTLMRAEEHKSDRGLMRDVQKLAGEYAAKASRIAKK